MTDRTLKRLRATALGVILILGSHLHAMAQEPAPTPWGAEFYNPGNEENLLTLPLPCGGQIGLVRVATETEGTRQSRTPLTDMSISMGRPLSQARSYIEARRPEHLAGSLRDPSTSEMFYLIGAYEVTVAQYRAVMAEPGACPAAPERKDLVPAGDLSWYDAIAFTRRLNQWIYAGTSNQLAALSQLGVDNGFVRLPTEAEWEFAARGGTMVSDAERSASVFFGDAPIDDYAWYNGAMSSSGKLKPVGGKLPNKLGLFDVYGNAEEMVMEPFRMTTPGRLHGGVGGFVSRGGSSLDEAETLTSARRDERPFFSVEMQGEYKRRTLGFRIVVGTASLPTDLTQIAGLEQAAEALQAQVAGSPSEQPIAQIARAAEQIDNGPLRAQIEGLNTELAEEFTRRNELRKESIRTSLTSSMLLTRELLRQERRSDRLKKVIDQFPPEQRLDYERDLEANNAEQKLYFNVYFNSLKYLAEADQDMVEGQVSVIESGFNSQARQRLIPSLQMVRKDVNLFARDGDFQKIVDRIKTHVFTDTDQ